MNSSASLLTIFGASGDLAQRMLLPALYGLESDRLLPDHLRVLGTARSEMDDDGFRRFVADALSRHVPNSEIAPPVLERLQQRLAYQPAAVGDAASMDTLGQTIRTIASGDIVYHLSTAPRWYAATCDALGAMGLGDTRTRVMLEKPIGRDLASATAINDGVARVFDEERVFRVDHYLGKEGVQNLLALRFGNVLFEPLWNARHVQQVQITVAETVGVEGRGDYYDEAGATRDMLQNHLLQMLCLVAMEPPAQFEAGAVRNEKLKVLQSLRPIGPAEVRSQTAIGQYVAGAIGGQPVRGYLEELGRPSDTETFVALRAHVDNWRWSGVPFYLRTGKRMPRRSTEIVLQFRPVPHSIFASTGAQMQPNALVIRLQPEERIELRLMSKTPGLDRAGLRLSDVALDLDLHEKFATHRRRSAYERLYLDAIENSGTLFVRRDEVDAAWRWVDALQAGWQQAGMRPEPYPAGTWGPGSAAMLAERREHAWHA
jgi:glucose-6-phosphate 1-dehydrogenase